MQSTKVFLFSSAAKRNFIQIVGKVSANKATKVETLIKHGEKTADAQKKN